MGTKNRTILILWIHNIRIGTYPTIPYFLFIYHSFLQARDIVITKEELTFFIFIYNYSTMLN